MTLNTGRARHCREVRASRPAGRGASAMLVALAGALSLAGVEAQTIDALRSSKEAVALREAFEPYRLCVADSAGRLMPNNLETAAAIAEAAEPGVSEFLCSRQVVEFVFA